MTNTLPAGPFVSCEWLSDHMEDGSIIIADCRYDLKNKSYGISEYLKEHIPGAYFLDMEKELTGMVKEHGGRHPIPEMQSFQDSMNRIGLEPGKLVVAYDQDGSGASRLWWLLKHFGHPEVRILDGSFPEWKDSGRPVTKEVPTPQNGTYRARLTDGILVTRDDLDKLSPGSRIIDVRARERYLGKIEPIDRIAGHIPGAINVPYREIMEKPGKFKNPEELEELFSNSGDEPVVYCGSGITSCVNFVALEYIGKHPKLYAGSWSDWISYEDSKVATGENP